MIRFNSLALVFVPLLGTACTKELTYGAIPDVRGAVTNEEQRVPSFCEWVGRYDSIIHGTLIRADHANDRFVEANGSITDTVTETCDGRSSSVAVLELEIAVEEVLFGADPGSTVVARLGAAACGQLWPTPHIGESNELRWEGVGTKRHDGTLYDTPLVRGQHVGVGLVSLDHPLSPVSWTLGQPQFCDRSATPG